jgi:putative peptide zinc metalloprotease protein
MTRRLLAFLITFLIAATPAAAQDTSAVAVNTTDGATVFELAFEIHKLTGSDPVTQQNLAVAYASCTACTTIAVSIQILLVMGDPDVIAPLNLAAAVNESCASCRTLASAYQFVIALGTPVRLTGRGQRAIRRIFRERAELPIDQVQARLDELMKQLRTVLTTQVVKKRDDDHDDGEDRHEGDRAGEDVPASEAASPEPTPATAETATPEPVVTPEATPTETPTETPTPEETPTATPAP